MQWRTKISFKKGKSHTEGNENSRSVISAFLFIDLKHILPSEGHSQVFLKSTLLVASGITKHLSCSGSRDWVKIYRNFSATSASHSQVSSVYVTGILSHSETGWLFWLSPSSRRESKSKFVQDSISECWGQVGIACNWGAATTRSCQVWPHKNIGRELPDLLIFKKKKFKNLDDSSNF